jgi:hypothetical protein
MIQVHSVMALHVLLIHNVPQILALMDNVLHVMPILVQYVMVKLALMMEIV